MGPTFAVLDLETTGFGKHDRVVEVGLVVLSSSLETEFEFETLLNPERDMSATEVHGITASMVESAPTFAEIAGRLASLLHGRVITAHNLAFDQRFLVKEIGRTGLAFDPGAGLDTLALAGESLAAVCARLGIPHSGQHRALSDARATAAVLRHFGSSGHVAPATAVVEADDMVRTISRPSEQPEPSQPSILVRLPSSAPVDLAYLDVLDRFLADRALDPDERSALQELAADLSLTADATRALHFRYFRAARSAAQRDGVVSQGEHDYLTQLAEVLGVDPSEVPQVLQPAAPDLADGIRVCFTGSATSGDREVHRDELEALAAAHGLQPVSAVTQRGCDLLVAADPTSQSGKAKKARQFSIPVIGVDEFLRYLQDGDD